MTTTANQKTAPACQNSGTHLSDGGFTPTEWVEIEALPLLSSDDDLGKIVTLASGRAVRQFIWRRKYGHQDKFAPVPTQFLDDDTKHTENGEVEK